MLKMQIIGHIGKDADVREVNGQKVINFNVCHTEKFKDQNNQQVEKSTWVSCAKWGDNTAVAQYLKKGTLVFVEGVPDVRQYVNKDGAKLAQLDLRVGAIQLLGGGKKEDRHQAEETATAASANGGDDLPF